MRIKIGDLREELKNIDREIKSLGKRRSAIAGMIDAYTDAPPKTKPEPAPVAAPVAAPVVKKGKAPRRPTGASILKMYQESAPNAAMTVPQVTLAIGYTRKAEDEKVVYVTLRYLVQTERLAVNKLGLYVRGEKFLK